MVLVVDCGASVPTLTPDPAADDCAVLEGFNEAMNRHDFDVPQLLDCTIEIANVESVEGSAGTYHVTTRLAEREGSVCQSVGERNVRTLRVEDGKIVQLP